MNATEQASRSTILHRLRNWAQRDGSRPCLSYGEQDRSLSYAEFDAATDTIAAYLTQMGIRKGDYISVVTGNAFVAARTMFGIWKCGAVYCPMNINLNPEQLRYQMNDTCAALIITDTARLAKVGEAAAPDTPLIVHVPQAGDHDYVEADAAFKPASEQRLFSDLLAFQGQAPDHEPQLSDQTAIIYTSGTTGPPKGVVQTHAWLAGLCRSLHVWTHEDDVVYCDLPMHHIGGAFSMFARSLWSGASVSLWDRFSPGEFWHRINSGGVSVALLIDVMVNWICKQPETAEDANNPLAKVHVLPLPNNHFDIARRFGFDFFIAGYGSSELGNAFSGFIDEFPEHQGTPETLWKGHSKAAMKQRLVDHFGEGVIVNGDTDIGPGYMGVSVGTYQPTVEDEQRNTLAAGEVGQLVLEPQIPGALFSHYLNKPEKTAESVVDGRFYSSDIVARDERNIFYFKDRKQGFIRVRGENVSAASIEAELLRHDAVFQAAVVAVPAVEGAEDDVGAFIVKSEGAELSVETLTAWTVEQLPKFMRPRHLRFIDELPVTATMKVEKYKLREMLLREISI
ncbi:MAG: AMP-binding protein [Pseudomonadota bacterium]